MAKFQAFKMSITIRDPEEAQEFLAGCVLASQNNNSHYFPELIASLNSGLETYRKSQLDEEMTARSEAGMP